MGITVGRIVHYHHQSGQRLIAEAAIVAGVQTDGTVHLFVFYGNGAGGYGCQNVAQAETPTPGCWSWPPLAVRLPPEVP